MFINSIVKMTKKKKGPNKKVKAAELIMSRKAKRKEERKNKKQMKQNFILKRFGKDDKVKKVPNKVDVKQEMKEKRLQEQEEQRKAIELKKKKLDKKREKDKRKRLREENLAEEETIKSMAKKLKMNKKKGDDMDGLDFLMDACDGDFEKSDEEDEEEEDKEKKTKEGGETQEEEEEDDDDDEQLGASEEEEEEGDQDFGSLGDSEEGEDVADLEEHSDAEPDEAGEDSDEDKKEESTWEDIYGRTRDREGNVVTANAPTKYIPPALRARMAAEGNGDEAKRQEKLNKLRRRCKGILNRLAAATMSPMTREIEELYSASGHARADLNECLFGLLSESLLESPARTPERMILEHALLVALLHANVGIEVGATILQSTVEKYREFRLSYDPQSSEGNIKQLDNTLLFLSHLFTFKVMEAQLVFDILSELAEDFSEKDVELIVVVLRGAGFGLRKADPGRLKELILKVQKKAAEAKSRDGVNTRVDFMLEVIMAIKNNNVRKIPNYDDSHQQFLLKYVQIYLYL